MLGAPRPGEMNVTLVAWYGEKPPALAELIADAHASLGTLGGAFTPYRVSQVHATVIGLEGHRQADSDAIASANFHDLRGERRHLDWERLREGVLGGPLPLPIRIGGYRSDGTYSFLSRGRHPYERSFFFSGDAAVVIGWPRDPAPPQALGNWRRALECAGALHKYHGTPDALDDDLFFVVGRVRRAETSEEAMARVTAEVRERLAESTVEVLLEARDLYLAGYLDSTLPIETTYRAGVSSAGESLVRSLYGPRG